jgi:hypothetical protein
MLAAAVLAVLAVAALVATAVAGRARQAGPASPRQAARQPTATAPAPPAHPLRLVAGSRLVNGLYTWYPQSTAGAVSAAVEFITELGSTLEPDRAATIARLVADPSYGGAPAAAALGAISTRRQLGLPEAGPAPAGTAVLLVPVMYQLRDVTASRLTVLLLFDYTETAPSGITEHLGVTAARMNWTPAGWRLLPPAGPDPSGLVATPGTASATAKGWEAMTNAM